MVFLEWVRSVLHETFEESLMSVVVRIEVFSVERIQRGSRRGEEVRANH